MKISEILAKNTPTLSFEVFPPKTDAAFEGVRAATEEIALLRPDFMSVTFGAGGGAGAYTLEIAKNLQDNFGVTPLAHLTCVSSTKENILARLQAFKAAGIENIMALRGDIPKEPTLPREEWAYSHADELMREIKAYGDFCIGGACYPEIHPESPSRREDILHLKDKVEAGCDFLTTQMFFDNNILFNFLYHLREADVRVPVVAGIMPVTNAAQIRRIMQISSTQLPQRFKAIIDKFGDDPDAMMQAGIAYATDQIIDLYANGVNYVHLYTMNKPVVARKIMENLSAILGKK
ncbi:MAG: methylenetetrahydrofolate reductase [NAD(P)H] [Clostridia bacterium]|nr:methylenetetrahydrofolate reductase [NAD(P)H] [Clostridia bacterium]